MRHPHPCDDIYSIGITFLCIWTNRQPQTPADIESMKEQLGQGDHFRYNVVCAMIQPNMAARPTATDVGMKLSLCQKHMWANNLYPWSNKMPAASACPPPQQFNSAKRTV